MRIERGKSRVVIIAGEIAMKFPRIYFWTIIESFFIYVSWGLKDLILFFRYEIEFLLWRGIVSNFREFLFYRTYKFSCLVPTYFSFFGLINIQKAGQALEMSDVDVWDQIYEVTKGLSFEENDPHTFAEARNYCVIGKKVRIVDYGDWKTQKIIKRFGDSLLENFDLDYKGKEVEF